MSLCKLNAGAMARATEKRLKHAVVSCFQEWKRHGNGRKLSLILLAFNLFKYTLKVGLPLRLNSIDALG